MGILDLPLSTEFVFSEEGCRFHCIPVAICPRTGIKFVEYNGHKCEVTDKFNGYRTRGPIPILKSGRHSD